MGITSILTLKSNYSSSWFEDSESSLAMLTLAPVDGLLTLRSTNSTSELESLTWELELSVGTYLSNLSSFLSSVLDRSENWYDSFS